MTTVAKDSTVLDAHLYATCQVASTILEHRGITPPPWLVESVEAGEEKF